MKGIIRGAQPKARPTVSSQDSGDVPALSLAMRRSYGVWPSERPAVVGLYHVDAEREPSQHLVKEADGRPLVARIVNLEDANRSPFTNRVDLLEPGAGA